MLDFLGDLWGYLRLRKRYWMLPFLFVLLLVGVLVVLGQNAAVAPFIYTLF